MASVTVRGIGITDAWVRITGITDGDRVRIFVRTGRKSGTGSEIYDESHIAGGTSLEVELTGLDPETWYTANASLDGGSTWIGGFEFETYPDEIERPDDWNWWTDKEQDEEIYIEAEEWNAFTERINAFRLYDGDLDEYDFTYVYSGDKISHSIINEAREAIKPITGHGTLPDEVYEEDPLEASIFNKLRKALNAVE